MTRARGAPLKGVVSELYEEATDYLPTRVMDDVLYDTTNVTVAFCIVEIAEASRGFSVVGVCFELESGE
jgi:hypothetical protein